MSSFLYLCNLIIYRIVMKKATVALTDMEFYAFHGCFEEEQAIGTHFTVDLSFSYDAAKAIATDDVNEAINYPSVYESVKKVMDSPHHLIETVANDIILAIRHDFPEVKEVKVRVSKLNPPLEGKTRCVSVEIEG